jgi:DNA (cytosine-5)-methyltransferase 1
VGENVRGLTNWNGGLVFEEVCAELESYGYQVAPVIIPACAVNAPHRRERIWFVAYAPDSRHRGGLCERCTNRERELLPDQQERSEVGCETPGCSREWITTNADGTNKRNDDRANDRETEKVRRQNPGDVSREFRGDGNVTDADGRRTQSQQNIRQTLSGEKRTNSDGGEWNVTDSERVRLEYSTTPRQVSREKKNANGERSKSTLLTQTNDDGYKSDWDNFPTQSPICRGNDGLSSELDGITFPKWRNESIKAYGNAIVPQVAYQIFKAIEKTLYL